MLITALALFSLVLRRVRVYEQTWGTEQIGVKYTEKNLLLCNSAQIFSYLLRYMLRFLFVAYGFSVPESTYLQHV